MVPHNQVIAPCNKRRPRHCDTTHKGHGARTRAGHVSQRALKLDSHHHQVLNVAMMIHSIIGDILNIHPVTSVHRST